MTNQARKNDNEVKREKKAQHKADHKMRKLRRNRHNVWVGLKES